MGMMSLRLVSLPEGFTLPDILMDILSWNVQGAGSRSFCRTFGFLRQQFTPGILALCEPRISGQKADKFIKYSGYDFSFRVEANGFSGGIWLLWKHYINVQVILWHEQMIHARVTINDTYAFVTFVYGSPTKSRRRRLWEALDEVDPSCSGPWLIGGDFNSYLYESEKEGGLRTKKWRMPVV